MIRKSETIFSIVFISYSEKRGIGLLLSDIFYKDFFITIQNPLEKREELECIIEDMIRCL